MALNAWPTDPEKQRKKILKRLQSGFLDLIWQMCIESTMETEPTLALSTICKRLCKFTEDKPATAPITGVVSYSVMCLSAEQAVDKVLTGYLEEV